MHIADSMVASYGNFNLDIDAVEMKSISESDIKLPYHGSLPGKWRKIVTGPDRLLTILSSLSETDKEFLRKHMMDK